MNSETPILDLDGATRIDIRGVYHGEKFVDIELEHFEDEEETTPLVIEGDYTFVVSRDVNETNKLLTKAVVIVSNKMTISISEEENKLKPGQYYYTIKKDTEAFPMYYGFLTVYHKKGPWQ